MVHRLGRLEIGEASVAVAVVSPHRAEAFAACRFAIDTLKARVPIWKKEYYADGSAWLEGPGASAAEA
jgi:molybdopterin synthase catalytic subunit